MRLVTPTGVFDWIPPDSEAEFEKAVTDTVCSTPIILFLFERMRIRFGICSFDLRLDVLRGIKSDLPPKKESSFMSVIQWFLFIPHRLRLTSTREIWRTFFPIVAANISSLG